MCNNYSSSDTSSLRVVSVYKKTVVYFRSNIAFSNDLDLQHKIEDFEAEISLDLDNLPSGNFDYDFSYEGIYDASEDEFPAFLFD